MGCPTLSERKGNILKTKHIRLIFADELTQSTRPYYRNVLRFTPKPSHCDNNPDSIFQVSAITLNQATLSQNLSTKTSEIAVYLEGSEILSDERSIILTTQKFLQQMNRLQVETIQIHEPKELDLIGRRTIFKCVAHAITHFDAKVDLRHLNIRIINLCWDRDQAEKFYNHHASFIDVDNTLII